METRLQKKLKRGNHLVQTSYRSYWDNTFLLTWSKAATNVSCIPDQIHSEIHYHWMYRPGPYKRNLLWWKRHERAVPKNRNEKCNVIPKSNKYIQKNLKEISTRSNFSYKLFLYKKYSDKIWSFTQTVLKKNLFTTRRFSTNKLSIKPDSFYKSFPY